MHTQVLDSLAQKYLEERDFRDAERDWAPGRGAVRELSSGGWGGEDEEIGLRFKGKRVVSGEGRSRRFFETVQ